MRAAMLLALVFVSTANAQYVQNATPETPISGADLKWSSDPDCRPGNCPLGIHHVPGMLPGHPTAATLWPRIIRVECKKEGEKLKCDYPARSPSVGRAEYVLYEPVIHEPQVVNNTVIMQQPANPPEVIVKEVTVVKEVPPKKIKE